MPLPLAKNVSFSGGKSTQAFFIVLIGAGALVLRMILAANLPLWFDEIVSLAGAQRSSSMWSVFTLHVDNNHYLNTLYLRLVGIGTHPLFLRAPSVLAGTAIVIGVFFWPSARSTGHRILLALLFTWSFPLMFLSVYARGYAPMALCALAAFCALDRWLKSPTRPIAALFATLCASAMLFHLTFVTTLAALATYAWYVLSRAGCDQSSILGRMMLPFGPPAALIGFLWMIDGRHMRILGGPLRPLDAVLRDAALLGSGLPNNATFAAAGAALVGLLLMIALERRWYREPESAMLHTSTIVGFPLLFLLVLRPQYLDFRYVFLPLLFGLLLFAEELTTLFSRGVLSRAVATLAVAGYMAGNTIRIAEFARSGTGEWISALRHIESRSSKEAIVDGQKRNDMFYWYYGTYVSPGAVIRSAHANEPAQWLLRKNTGATEPEIIRGDLSYAPVFGLPTDGAYWTLYEERTSRP